MYTRYSICIKCTLYIYNDIGSSYSYSHTSNNQYSRQALDGLLLGNANVGTLVEHRGGSWVVCDVLHLKHCLVTFEVPAHGVTRKGRWSLYSPHTHITHPTPSLHPPSTPSSPSLHPHHLPYTHITLPTPSLHPLLPHHPPYTLPLLPHHPPYTPSSPFPSPSLHFITLPTPFLHSLITSPTLPHHPPYTLHSLITLPTLPHHPPLLSLITLPPSPSLHPPITLPHHTSTSHGHYNLAEE